MKVRVEGHNYAQDQKILRWRQADNFRGNFRTTEETAAGAARIVNSVLQPHYCPEVAVRDAIFQSRRVCLNGLPETRQASVTIPVHLWPRRCAPIVAEDQCTGN